MSHYLRRLLGAALVVSMPVLGYEVIFEQMEYYEFSVAYELKDGGVIDYQNLKEGIGVRLVGDRIGLVTVCQLEHNKIVGFQDVVLFDELTGETIEFNRSYPYPIFSKQSLSLPCAMLEEVDIADVFGFDKEIEGQIKAALMHRKQLLGASY
ncbi:hypothetical protein M2404_003891 [Rheinheimera pacifica]|uniref:hypothetical protein n=1 Tax=Rheinheimera pacifica TaxID=173990 RepID=UPI002169BC3F|nr:hypothetical protein [Rheinheimera pacifica]MCS4309519.1 hypothetical protein [Rheinheimera pacifica]